MTIPTPNKLSVMEQRSKKHIKYNLNPNGEVDTPTQVQIVNLKWLEMRLCAKHWQSTIYGCTKQLGLLNRALVD